MQSSNFSFDILNLQQSYQPKANISSNSNFRDNPLESSSFMDFVRSKDFNVGENTRVRENLNLKNDWNKVSSTSAFSEKSSASNEIVSSSASEDSYAISKNNANEKTSLKEDSMVGKELKSESSESESVASSKNVSVEESGLDEENGLNRKLSSEIGLNDEFGLNGELDEKSVKKFASLKEFLEEFEDIENSNNSKSNLSKLQNSKLHGTDLTENGEVLEVSNSEISSEKAKKALLDKLASKNENEEELSNLASVQGLQNVNENQEFNLEELKKTFKGDLESDSELDKKGVVSRLEKNKVVFTVEDLRTSSVEENQIATNDVVEKSNLKSSVKYDGANNVQVTFDINQTQATQNILSSSSQTASASGSNFQAMLENLVQENASDFARSASIVLKDNNIGSISLVLHPEALGNVKINLELTDKLITGHITVNSKEAMAAFESNLTNLKNAFSESGFQNASFDLSMAGQNAGGFKNNSQSDSYQMQMLSKESYSDYADVALETSTEIGDVNIKSSVYTVDIVA